MFFVHDPVMYYQFILTLVYRRFTHIILETIKMDP